MSDRMTVATSTREAIDQIEEAYEFMLAYAAQGRQIEGETEGESQIRGFLKRFKSSLDVLVDAIPVLLPAGSSGHAFSERFSSDALVVKSIIELLIEQDSITSDMIDNTNGLIAVRALLTDLFFVDQVIVMPLANE